MKSKSYEMFGAVYFCFVVFILFLIFILFMSACFCSIKKYKMLSGVVISSEQVMLMVSSKQLDWFYKNKVLMIDGEKCTFDINHVNQKIQKVNHKWYHQIFLDVTLDKYQENDTILLGVYQDKVSFFSLFFDIWRGG